MKYILEFLLTIYIIGSGTNLIDKNSTIESRIIDLIFTVLFVCLLVLVDNFL